MADVENDRSYHVGDEAILTATINQVRHLLPAARITVVSRDPAWTREKHNVDAVMQLSFSNSRISSAQALRIAQLQALEERCNNFMADGQMDKSIPEDALVAAIGDSNGVIISGGGNLNSILAGLLYQRLAAILIARALHRPVIISGQTIGPLLLPEDRPWVIEALKYASFVGCRDMESAKLLTRLGIAQQRIHLQLDDAIMLAPSKPARDLLWMDALHSEHQPWIAVTLHKHKGMQSDLYGNLRDITGIAEQLTFIAQRTNAALVFIPHHNVSNHSDIAVGIELQKALGTATPLKVLDMFGDQEVAWLTQQADMVISTRYHPLVFSLGGAVPCLGIYQDEYTRIKIVGVLEHAGLEQWALPLSIAKDNSLSEAVLELWGKRQSIKNHLLAFEDNWRLNEVQHWEQIFAVLNMLPGQKQLIPRLRINALKPDGTWSRTVRRWYRFRRPITVVLSRGYRYARATLRRSLEVIRTKSR